MELTQKKKKQRPNREQRTDLRKQTNKPERAIVYINLNRQNCRRCRHCHRSTRFGFLQVLFQSTDSVYFICFVHSDSINHLHSNLLIDKLGQRAHHLYAILVFCLFSIPLNNNSSPLKPSHKSLFAYELKNNELICLFIFFYACRAYEKKSLMNGLQNFK